MSTTQLEPTSPLRRAAILMVLLGPDTAGRLLSNLPRELISPITAEVTKLDNIPDPEAQEVLERYFIEAIQPEQHRGGRDVAREMLASAEIPEHELKLLLADDYEPEKPATTVLGPLLDSPPEALARALSAEHPQTAALVLLHLTSTVAAKVMAQMTEQQRGEVVQRMTSLRRVEGEILTEVAASLQDRMRDPAAEVFEQEDGMAKTAAVLQQMKRSEVRGMLDEMEQVDPERAQLLRAMVNTFDQLVLANDRGTQELLRSVETKTLVLALHGEEQALVDKFLNNLSERAGAMFREEMEFLSDVRPDDQKVAQNEIMAKALELEQEDRLIFEEPQGDDL